MKQCVKFPEDKFLAVRSCLVAICMGNRPAANLLSILLFRYNLRMENKDDAENQNAVKAAKGESPDQDTSVRIFRTQAQLVDDMCGEITEKTLHDTAVPMLQLLGFLDLEEHMIANCYILHIQIVQHALNLYSPGKKEQPQLEKFLISTMQLEKFLITSDELEIFLIDKKNFQLGLEKVLIQNRKISYHQRGRKLSAGVPLRGKKRAPKNLEEDSKKDTEEESTFVADATPAPLQENVFADDDPEKTVERLPAVHIETTPPEVPASYSTNDYTNEGEDDGDTARAQNAGRPQSDGAGLLRGATPGASALRGEAGAADGELTPSQQTNPDVLAGAASDDGQALDAAAIAPPGSAPSASGGKGANGKALLCEPAKVRAALVAFRGYALESAGALINENKAIKAWCALHSEGELALVMEALETDRYWGKVENREHFTVANFATETPKMLARLKRKGEPRVLDDGATSEWDFANYIGNGPEDMAAWMRRAEAQEAQGLLNF